VRTVRLTLAHDGTDFFGWQVQSVGRTVQGELEAALEKITGERVRIAGAGRTDSGVHALGQVASFRTTSVIPSDKLRLGLESVLTTGDLVVLGVADVPEDFHARHSARGKLYRYQVLNSRLRSPFLRRYTWQVRAKLDRTQMREAAAALLGTHDFSSFRLAGCDARTPVREMHRLELIERDDGVLWIELEASAFLRGMARAIVGTLVEIGRGRSPASDMPAIVTACDRGAAGRSAPACGLTLVRVDYE